VLLGNSMDGLGECIGGCCVGLGCGCAECVVEYFDVPGSGVVAAGWDVGREGGSVKAPEPYSGGGGVPADFVVVGGIGGVGFTVMEEFHIDVEWRSGGVIGHADVIANPIGVLP